MVHERPVQLHDRVRSLGHLVQEAAEPRHGEERQLAAYMYVMDSFRFVVGDPGAGEAVQGDADGDGDAQGDALQDAEEHHAAGGDRVDQHLTVAGHRANVVQRDHLEADGHDQGGERGERDELQGRDQQQRGDHYENAVQHRGVPADGARRHVRRTAHGHPGDGQPAQRPGDDVGGALPEQFAVEVGTLDVAGLGGPGGDQFVHRDRAEQGLHAAHQRGGEDGGDQAEYRAVGQGGQGVAAPGRQVDLGQDQPGEGGDRGGAGDGDQGGGQSAQHLTGPAGDAGPQQQKGQGQHAHGQVGGVQVRQLGGQRDQVVRHGALRGAAEDDVQLGDGDGDADAGEHAVHDGRAHRERRARHAQAAQAQLGQPGEHGDGAGRTPPVALDEVGGDHGESGGGAADLERTAADPSGDDAAHRGGDEAGLEGRPGGQGDAQGEGQGDQEDRDRGRDVGARDAEAPGTAGRRAVRWVDVLGPGRIGAGGDAG